MRGLFLAGALGLALAVALPALAGGQDDLGAWHVIVSDLSQWSKAPELTAESQAACYLYGVGKFRVTFRQGAATQRYTVTSPGPTGRISPALSSPGRLR